MTWAEFYARGVFGPKFCRVELFPLSQKIAIELQPGNGITFAELDALAEAFYTRRINLHVENERVQSNSILPTHHLLEVGDLAEVFFESAEIEVDIFEEVS